MIEALALPAWAILIVFPVWFALNTAAAARLTHLVTTDSITDRPRVAVTEWADRRRATRPLAVLINCGWCVSVWVSAALAAFDWWAGGPLERGVAAAGYEHGAAGWCIIVAALALAAGMLAVKTR
jgi:hypothetical protein